MAETGGESARHILGGKRHGKHKAHTHAMHIERSDNGGFVAKHEMRHKDGSSPREHDPHHHDPTYTLSDLDALKAHVGQSMEPPEPPDEAEGGPPPPPPGGPGGPPPPPEPDEDDQVVAGGQ